MSVYKSVWKYPLMQPVIELELPLGAKVVTVATQDNVPTLWIEVPLDDAIPKEKRTFIGHGTGHPVPMFGEKYVGTAHNIDGWMAFHIYERIA